MDNYYVSGINMKTVNLCILTLNIEEAYTSISLHKGPSINSNVHRNPSNVRKGGGGKCLVRILLLTKTLKISIIPNASLVSEIKMREIMTVLWQ